MRAATAADGRVCGSRRSSASMSGASRPGRRGRRRGLKHDSRSGCGCCCLAGTARGPRRPRRAWRRATTGRRRASRRARSSRSGADVADRADHQLAWVSRESPSDRAMPKSVSTARSFGVVARPVRGEQDVVRLHVPVQHPGGVHGGERAKQLLAEFGRRAGRTSARARPAARQAIRTGPAPSQSRAGRPSSATS